MANEEEQLAALAATHPTAVSRAAQISTDDEDPDIAELNREFARNDGAKEDVVQQVSTRAGKLRRAMQPRMKGLSLEDPHLRQVMTTGGSTRASARTRRARATADDFGEQDLGGADTAASGGGYSQLRPVAVNCYVQTDGLRTRVFCYTAMLFSWGDTLVEDPSRTFDDSQGGKFLGFEHSSMIDDLIDDPNALPMTISEVVKNTERAGVRTKLGKIKFHAGSLREYNQDPLACKAFLEGTENLIPDLVNALRDNTEGYTRVSDLRTNRQLGAGNVAVAPVLE